MKPYDDISLSKEEYQSGWIEAYQRKKGEFLWKQDPIEFLPNYAPILRENKVQSILEAGCGDGRNVVYLLREGFRVIGVDLSPIALANALDLADHQGKNDACFVNADLESLPHPFPEHSFDALTCLDVFGQVLEVEQTVSGFQRVVRPNGLLLLNLYTPEDAAFGVGQKLGDRSFLYNKTLFRFFTEQDIRTLFAQFDILKMEKMHWQDPPHPGYRDDYHIHDSFVFLLRNRR